MATQPADRPGARNLIVCCDGTANEFSDDRTNVLKLAYAAVKEPSKQLLFYHPGVGTMAPPGLFTRIGKWLARLAGKAFGFGLKADIRNVYSFIMNHYRPGDRIYIFGFSRGAYTARAVVALLHAYGLLGPGNEALVPYAIRLLWNYDVARTKKQRAAAFRLSAEFKKTLSTVRCEPHFVGLWDTVSSVGWIANPLSLPYTRRLPGVKIVRHAVAIDERRSFFRTNLVEKKKGRDIEEVWFPGVHSDIGGGYKEAESGLSKLPLRWMIDEARTAGLLFDDDRVKRVLGLDNVKYAKPDPKAKMHNPLLPFWWIAEFIPKQRWNAETNLFHWRLNLFRRRRFGPAPVIDDSAWHQETGYIERLPADAVRKSLLTTGSAAAASQSDSVSMK